MDARNSWVLTSEKNKVSAACRTGLSMNYSWEWSLANSYMWPDSTTYYKLLKSNCEKVWKLCLSLSRIHFQGVPSTLPTHINTITPPNSYKNALSRSNKVAFTQKFCKNKLNTLNKTSWYVLKPTSSLWLRSIPRSDCTYWRKTRCCVLRWRCMSVSQRSRHSTCCLTWGGDRSGTGIMSQ